MFAIYIDDVVRRIELSNIGCCIKLKCVSILLYADDIILISPSVVSLQKLLFVCELELNWLDMTVNPRKSVCLRIGPRFKAQCQTIITADGCQLKYADSIRYLGVHIASSTVFHCSVETAKRSFYRSFNAIFWQNR